MAEFIATPWDEDAHPGITEVLFDPAGRFGPIPFRPGLLDLRELETRVRAHLWAACSEAILTRQPTACWYAEKVAVPCGPLLDAGIPMRIIDCVRDPRDVLASIRAFTTVPGVDGFGRRPGEPEAAYLPRFVARFAERLDEITRLIVEKLLLTPTEQLKAVNDEALIVAYADALNRLFSLAADEKAPKARA